MKYKIGIIFILLGFLSASMVIAKKEDTSSAKKEEVNLPGVRKITQEYDQKFLQDYNQHQTQATELSQKVASFDSELVAKCKDQQELSSDCKEVLIKQTEAQIKMFQSFFDLYSKGLKLMHLKKEALEASNSSGGFVKKLFK